MIWHDCKTCGKTHPFRVTQERPCPNESRGGGESRPAIRSENGEGQSSMVERPNRSRVKAAGLAPRPREQSNAPCPEPVMATEVARSSQRRPHSVTGAPESGRRTDEALAREGSQVRGSRPALDNSVPAKSDDHETRSQAGVGSERSSPSRAEKPVKGLDMDRKDGGENAATGGAVNHITPVAIKRGRPRLEVAHLTLEATKPWKHTKPPRSRSKWYQERKDAREKAR